ncbi:MAG: AAA family ATPase [Desulfovibrionaceae bacterium]|nr:AAA family ATPase [Desulfovibrionaceae bacterium]
MTAPRAAGQPDSSSIGTAGKTVRSHAGTVTDTDDFRQLREKGAFYADKTVFLARLLGSPVQHQVTHIMRPHGFGRSLTLSMLHEFLTVGRDSRRLFAGLAIMEKRACAGPG